MFDNLYIHVPFCRRKCGYCAFYSMPAVEEAMQEKYVSEMEYQMADYSILESFRSLYLGGGTPSLLPRRLFERLFLAVNATFQMASGAEISVECNPETITPDNAALISAFANRISLGVQSFSPELRQLLDRGADNHDIETAVSMFRHYRVENLSMDLIYAIPGQTLDDWLNELQMAVEHGIRHLSCYSLTIEEGTAIAGKYGYAAVDDELSADMWLAAGEFLHRHGIERYEVSNYAAPGHECRHNMNIWHGGTYLGLGPAACSFDGFRRWTQVSDLEQWLRRVQPEIDDLAPAARARELLVFGLRTAVGWHLADWLALPNHLAEVLPWAAIMSMPELHQLKQQGLLSVTDDHIAPTSQGLAFWDNIGEALI